MKGFGGCGQPRSLRLLDKPTQPCCALPPDTAQSAQDREAPALLDPGRLISPGGRASARRPLLHPHLNVWDAVQIQGAQNIEHSAALVILGKTWCVDGGPHLVHNLPKGALKGCRCCGWKESREWHPTVPCPTSCPPAVTTRPGQARPGSYQEAGTERGSCALQLAGSLQRQEGGVKERRLRSLEVTPQDTS